MGMQRTPFPTRPSVPQVDPGQLLNIQNQAVQKAVMGIAGLIQSGIKNAEQKKQWEEFHKILNQVYGEKEGEKIRATTEAEKAKINIMDGDEPPPNAPAPSPVAPQPGPGPQPEFLFKGDETDAMSAEQKGLPPSPVAQTLAPSPAPAASAPAPLAAGATPTVTPLPGGGTAVQALEFPGLPDIGKAGLSEKQQSDLMDPLSPTDIEGGLDETDRSTAMMIAREKGPLEGAKYIQALRKQAAKNAAAAKQGQRDAYNKGLENLGKLEDKMKGSFKSEADYEAKKKKTLLRTQGPPGGGGGRLPGRGSAVERTSKRVLDIQKEMGKAVSEGALIPGGPKMREQVKAWARSEFAQKVANVEQLTPSQALNRASNQFSSEIEKRSGELEIELSQKVVAARMAKQISNLGLLYGEKTTEFKDKFENAFARDVQAKKYFSSADELAQFMQVQDDLIVPPPEKSWLQKFGSVLGAMGGAGGVDQPSPAAPAGGDNNPLKLNLDLP